MQLFFEDRDGWRAWLEAHHATVREVWLVFFKKHTGRVGLPYGDAVEEALCFGWIDSLVKRLDDDRYARKFTPRTDTTTWSASNLERIRSLIASGRMTDAGLAKVPADVEPQPSVASRPLEIPVVLAVALDASPDAKRFFEALPPSARRDVIHWVGSAKRQTTRERRVAEAISLFANGRRLGLR